MTYLKIFLFVLSLILVACDQEAEDPTAEKLSKESGEAYEALKGYAEKKQRDFQQTMQTTLRSFDDKMRELKAKADEAGAMARQEYDAAMAKWEGQAETLNRELDDLNKASAEKWADLEAQIYAGIKELEKLYEDAESAVNP